MTDENLVPIGVFARAARLTVKALRHYQSERLIVPAWTDPSTSYRYFTMDQLDTAVRIATLRELDVSVPSIRAHLEGTLSADDLVAAERDRRHAEIERSTRALAMLDSFTAHALPDAYEIDDVAHGSMATLAVSGPARSDHLGTDATEVIERLLSTAERLNIDTAPAVWGEYPVELSDPFSVTAHLPLQETQDPENRIGGGRYVGRIEGGRFARTVHRGPTAALPYAYRALLTHLELIGTRPHGTVFERYITDPGSTEPLANEVEILYRLT